MRANQIRRLPVVGPDGELLGILSLADIARVANVAPKLGTDPDISGGLVATLAGICTTPPPSIPRTRPGATL